MARQKRNSTVLERAKRRLESLVSIDRNLDFGAGLTVREFSTLISDLDTKLASYNTTLSAIDKLADDITVSERAVRAMAEQLLLGVGGRYGKVSQEYEMAGGKRRKGRGVTKPTATALSETTTIVGEPSRNGAAKRAVA